MSDINTSLLEQYIEMLGVEGLVESMRMFTEIMPSYLCELEEFVADKDKEATRSQAHKMKGACRSMGFMGLSHSMEYIEKESWNWQEVEALLETWPKQLSQDLETSEAWLNAKTEH